MGETLEQFADRIVAETRKVALDQMADDVIGKLKGSHLAFAKICVMAAIAVAMKEGPSDA